MELAGGCVCVTAARGAADRLEQNKGLAIMLFGFRNEKEVEKAAPVQEPEVSTAPSSGDGLDSPNSALCAEELTKILAEKKAHGAILKLYLENFKLFNDTFGRDYAEMFLRQVISFLRGIENTRVFRSAGVEFVLILEQQNFMRANDVAQIIREKFERAWRIGDMDYMCAVSLGLVFYPDFADTAEELLKSLDYAVSEASQKGQNALAVFDSGLQKKLYRRRKIAKLINEAVATEALEIRFRPTLRVEDGVFARAECYLQINSAEFGVIGAAEFIPIAEDSGQICAVNNYAIRRACEEIRRLLDDNVDFESIAVPVSPVQFLQEQFLQELKTILDIYRVPPKKLAFEITESVLINSLQQINIIMQELAEIGIEFILNEFGTGYSGVNNILDLPVDVLKLERLFVWQMETNPRSCYLIEGLIQIARNLGLKLIAEGVETENQVNLLKEYGCSYEQGFYYSPTVDAKGLHDILGKPWRVSAPL